MFNLDARLATDTWEIGRMALCQVRLMDDEHYPWVILIPEREGISEIHELTAADRSLLLDESTKTARVLSEMYVGGKLNIAALGNVVRQLHVHHVVRFAEDRSWPGPVWGAFPPKRYPAEAASELVGRLRARLIGD